MCNLKNNTMKKTILTVLTTLLICNINFSQEIDSTQIWIDEIEESLSDKEEARANPHIIGFNLVKIQLEIQAWAQRNFPDESSQTCILGMTEELGEVAHADLKDAMGIRGTHEEHLAESRDAVGDLLIFLLSYCGHKGFVVEDVLKDTWDTVKLRDWVKFPLNGKDK